MFYCFDDDYVFVGEGETLEEAWNHFVETTDFQGQPDELKWVEGEKIFITASYVIKKVIFSTHSKS